MFQVFPSRIDGMISTATHTKCKLFRSVALGSCSKVRVSETERFGVCLTRCGFEAGEMRMRLPEQGKL